MGNTHHCTKYRQNRFFVAEILQFFKFSKWPSPPSWIFQIVKFYWLLGWRGSRHMSVPNFIKIGQSVAKILRLFDFTRWRWPPSWVFIFVKCYWLTVSEGHKHITVPNFVKIGRSVAEILRFVEFSRWLPPPSWFLETAKLVVRFQRVETHLHAKFCQNLSINCEDIKIFRFFKMAAILDFQNYKILLADGVWRAQTHNCAKFRHNRRSFAEILRFFEFSRWPPPPSWIFEIAKFY